MTTGLPADQGTDLPADAGPDLVGLLHSLARARAFERSLASALRGRVERDGNVVSGPRPDGSGGEPLLSPAVPAAWALNRRDDGTGDLFSLRAGTAAAALAFGLEPVVLFRQALGRASAPAAGRDPGCFPTDLQRGLLAPVPLPGTLVEVLAGVALAFRLRKQPRVALLVDDADGSASGFWHEGLNLAAVRRAPLVLVIDASRRRPQTARPDRLSVRAPAYGIEARTVGADPADVLAAVRGAISEARAGQGTRLVEVTGAPDDAFQTLAGRLEWAGLCDAPRAAAIAEEAEHEMAAALERVASEPEPQASDALVSAVSGAEPPAPPFAPSTAARRG